jgi:hypothetical protein
MDPGTQIQLRYFEVKSAACQLLREFEFALSPGQLVGSRYDCRFTFTDR